MTNGRSTTLGERPTALIYGPVKIGKSSAVIRALGPRCFFICTERGALIPASNPEINATLRTSAPWRPVLGQHYVECLAEDDPCGEVLAVVDRVAPLLGNRFAAVCIDTLSSLVDRDLAYLDARGADTHSGRYGKYGGVYPTLYARVKRILWRLMPLRVVVVATAHEQDPSTIEGRYRPGGAKLPGQLVKDTPSLFDIVLRCGIEAGDDGSPRAVFRCDRLDQSYVTGDRFGVVRAVEPLDLRAVLRRAFLASQGRWGEVEKELSSSSAAGDAVSQAPI